MMILWIACGVVGYVVLGGLMIRLGARMLEGPYAQADIDSAVPWLLLIPIWPFVAVVIGITWLPAKLAWAVYPSRKEEEDEGAKPARAPCRLLAEVATRHITFRDGTKQVFEKASMREICNATWLRISHGNTVSTFPLAEITSLASIYHGETLPVDELK